MPDALPLPAASIHEGAEPDPPRRSLRETVYDLLLEAFAVVLGISLALFADGCKEDVADRARADVARASLVAEVAANRTAVAASRDYHRMLMDSLGARARRDASAPPVGFFSRGFLHTAPVRATAWETAAATGALSLLDYDEVLTFSRLYATQDAYHEAARNGGRVIFDALYAGGTEGVAANYRNLAALVSSTWYLEHDLYDAYGRTLAAIGADTSAAAPPVALGTR